MKMPEPDASIIARKDEIAAALRAIVPGEGVIVDRDGIARLRKRRADRLPAARR